MAYLGDFDAGTRHGSLLRAALTGNETADEQLKNVREMILQMRTGDGSSLSHYDEVVKFFKWGGYTSTQGNPTVAQQTLARDSFLELDSAYLKTSGDGPVTDVRTARDQLYAKHRG